MVPVSSRENFYTEKYFPSLDGLRALSIIPVVWHHATPYPLPGVFGRGGIGVDLFFAISGFLITTLLLRERQTFGTIDLRAFYLRRTLRIFPLYYLVLGLNIAYALWVRPDWEPSRHFLAHVPYYLTYTANWFQKLELAGPSLFVFAWSLCTEEQFYGFWAPLLRYSKRLSVAAWAMVAIVVLDLLLESTACGTRLGLPPVVRVILTSVSCPIGFGALLAMAAHHPRFGRRVVALAALPPMVPLVFLFTLGLVLFPWAPVVVLHGSLALLVLVCTARKRHVLSAVFEHPVIAFVGRVSYGIYLWHVAVLGGIKAVFPSVAQQPLGLFLLGLPLSVAVAAVSYTVFEKPWLRRARRYQRRYSVETRTERAITAALDG